MADPVQPLVKCRLILSKSDPHGAKPVRQCRNSAQQDHSQATVSVVELRNTPPRSIVSGPLCSVGRICFRLAHEQVSGEAF